MCAATRLSSDQLRRPCSPAEIPFETTDQSTEGDGVVIGQERAVQALRFGIGIRRRGYNLFAVGPAGVGKQTLLRQLLGQHAAQQPLPSDWCYVHEFEDPDRPRVLELPAGRGLGLQHDMANAVSELRESMREVFEGAEHRTRKQEIVDQFTERQDRALSEMREGAMRRDVAVLRTETGVALAPTRDGRVLDPDRFRSLPPDQRAELQSKMDRIRCEMQALFSQFQEWGHEHNEALERADRETASVAARRVIDRVRARYSDLPAVIDYLNEVERDAGENAADFLERPSERADAAFRHALEQGPSDGLGLRRYHINLLVDRTDARGAPVVREDHPTHANLIGRVEHESQFGALMTNFTHIKPGAFHRANGGYLILNALEVLRQPQAWEAVKRTVRSGEVRIESLGQTLGLMPTVSLEPRPVPLGSTKVVLTGERMLYHMLAAVDPDFLELFKVLIDFDESMTRGPEAQHSYADMVAALASREGLRPLDRSAVARVIDRAARAAGDAEKLSVHMRGLVDLLLEADFWAGEEHREVATAADVQKAIDAQRYRAGRVRERFQEAVRRDDLLVSTTGESVGQVNGLSVFSLGEHMFGHPTRITAQTRLGRGEVVDIEREVALGGPIHSKGVLILGGFLGARYATDVPLSLSATLVFEQNYSGVEGDSASLAELCALLSSLAQVPVRQSLALTGSVNQHGRVQSIGGVNEKIEGFFDVCRERGLTGHQGVLIPRTNVKNLMVRQEVVDAVERGAFHIYSVEDVDDALALLTGRKAGERDESGLFPESSINGLVEARLIGFAEHARRFAARPSPESPSV